MKINSTNHTFEVQVENRPIIHLKSSLKAALFTAVQRYSSGFLRIETKSTMETLKRLKTMTDGEIELLEIIRKTLKATEYAECFIMFRR